MAKRKPGKVIDTFHYHQKGENLILDLRLVKDVDGRFSYLVENDNPKFSLTDSDPNKLKRAVFDLLNEKLTIQWTPMLVIGTSTYLMQVNRHGFNGFHGCALHGLSGSRSLAISIRGVEIGKNNKGEDVYRFHDIDGVQFPGDVCGGSPIYKDDREVMIPDTTENRAKLESITNAFEVLGQKLHNLLSKDSIIATLANVKLLGLPEPKTTTDQKSVIWCPSCGNATTPPDECSRCGHTITQENETE